MPVLHFSVAGSRPAMTLLVVAPPWTTALSVNLRCATPVLPIAIGRPTSSPFRPLPTQAVKEPRQQPASAEIPIASDAQLRHTSRGFLPWRFADAGPRSARRRHHGAGIRKPSQTRKLPARATMYADPLPAQPGRSTHA